jgi:hypothetical protein
VPEKGRKGDRQKKDKDKFSRMKGVIQELWKTRGESKKDKRIIQEAIGEN